jgi:hypothetical protein
MGGSLFEALQKSAALWLALGALALAGLVAMAVVWRRAGFQLGSGGGDLPRWQRASRNWANLRDLRANLVSEKQFLADGCGNRLFLGWFKGRAVVSTPYASLLIVASTGSGKTTKLIVQNILAHKAGPVVSTTVKADVMELTRAQREKNGSTCRYYDPLGLYQVASIRVSPLQDVHKFSDAQAVAIVLLDASKSLDDTRLNGQAFWDSHGRQVLAPLLLVAVKLGWSMCDVRKLLARKDLVQRTLMEIGDKSALTSWQLHVAQPAETMGNVESTVAQVLEVWEHEVLRPVLDVGDHLWLGTDPRSNASVWDDAGGLISAIAQTGAQPPAPTPAAAGNPAGWPDRVRRLAAWIGGAAREGAPTGPVQTWVGREKNEDDLTWAARGCEDTARLPAAAAAPGPAAGPPDRIVSDVFDIGAFLESGDTLYLLSTQETQDAYAPLFDALLGMIMARLEQHSATHGGLPLNPGILFAIDEAANIAPLKKLAVIVTKIRGEGGLFITVWQSRAQIFATYGHDKGDVVWDNHLNKVFLGGISDKGTTDYMTGMVGRDMRAQTSVTKTRDGSSSSTQWYERDVFDTHFYNSVLTGDEAVLEVRQPDSKVMPAIVDVPAWFDDKRIRRLIPPEVAARYDNAFAGGAERPKRGWRR